MPKVCPRGLLILALGGFRKGFSHDQYELLKWSNLLINIEQRRSVLMTRRAVIGRTSCARIHDLAILIAHNDRVRRATRFYQFLVNTIQFLFS